MKVFVIRSTQVDRVRQPLAIDALCDKDGDMICWKSCVSAEEHLTRNLDADRYFVAEVESDDVLESLVRYNQKTGIGLKLAILMATLLLGANQFFC